MHIKRLILATAALTLAGLGSSFSASENLPIPGPNEILKTLKKEHPRLLASSEDFAQLRQRIKQEELLRAWHAEILEQGQKILAAEPSRYEIPDGLRLLHVSRRVLQRIQTLGLLYRLHGGRQYAERAWQELEAAAQFKDWNPKHFLDTAEMTHAFALGYDWLYDAWTPDQRRGIRAAIVEKGLKLALGCYDGTQRYGSWMRVRHNWNQVCNGGIGMGALAIAEEEPGLAGDFLSRSLQSLQLPMAEFAPDGAWNEGPGYWNYATTYNCVILAALDTALGTDFGLRTMAGFDECGTFPMFMTGPTQRTFNYADASDGTIRAPHMFWLARKFNRPEYAHYQARAASPAALDLIWYDATLAQAPVKRLPLDKYYRGVEAVAFRGSWEDANALFAGFKAGDNKANHSNLDLGSFVLDALGARWAVDLGADNYNLPGYFGNQRWHYYRLRAEGHNTLVINPSQEPGQDPKAATKILRFASEPRRAFALADLTPAYAKHARKVWRGFALLDRQRVLIQDEIQSDQPAEVFWFMHTPARIQIDSAGTSARLRLNDKEMLARILSPSQAKFTALDAAPLPTSTKPEKQAQNKGIRKLAIQTRNIKDLRLTVVLEPVRAGQADSRTQVIPLADW